MASKLPLVSSPSTEAPPPPPPLEESNPWHTLPSGWSTAVSPQDGRIYYWQKSTGKTSWTHPMAEREIEGVVSDHQATTRGRFTNRPWNMFTTRSEFHDTPWNATRRPDNHQCYAMASLVLFFPVGVCAVYQSICVDRAWSESRYGDAVNHSRQAAQYACFGTFAGAVLWIWYLLDLDRGRIFEWFRFD